MSALSVCRRLVLATTNAHKLRELRRLLAPLGVPLVGLGEIGTVVSAVAEEGDSLSEISRAKASAYARQLGEWVLSDDTGLEVDALGGAPGVRTARYAGESATMAENRAKLLADLVGYGPAERGARFVCCLSVAAPDGEVVLEATGICPGRIRTEPSGDAGFGYDVLFEVDGLGRTLAELDDAQTAEVGHRGRAVREIVTNWQFRLRSN
jgi:XTP/dITP diphosphohydrolase